MNIPIGPFELCFSDSGNPKHFLMVFDDWAADIESKMALEMVTGLILGKLSVTSSGVRQRYTREHAMHFAGKWKN